ncbi:OPT family oligopeptide transporter [Fusibacter bizertensis]
MSDKFKPFIPAHKTVPELTITSIIFGVVLAVIFGVVNAYLGLKVGMTISASIPAAVVSMSVTRIIMKRDSILENNMVQTIGSAGESLTAGAIFTIPAMFLWSKSMGIEPPSILLITLIGLCGGILGVMFMIPLRKALIVNEHENLPYPEGSACADVLLAGEEGGEKAKATFRGLAIGGIYKFISDGLALIPSNLEWVFSKPMHSFFGIDAMPALLGVGFVIGRAVSGFMLAGSLIGWFVIIPLIALVGEGSNLIIFPANISIGELATADLWHYYIRYIGAGAVAFGGLLSLIKSLPLIFETFIESMREYNHILEGKNFLRTDQDIPMTTVVLVVLGLTVLIALLPVMNVGFFGAIFVAVFGFFFATVSSRIVGLIGSSSNPISGMTLATLILAAFMYRSLGRTSSESVYAVFTVGAIICIIIAMAGDTSQDLKTGYLVGATPYKQQIGELIGVLVMSLILGAVLTLFNQAWGFGSTTLPAPQATLIKIIVEGVMQGNLPWTLIFIGFALGVIFELLKLPVLPIAIGLYLPIQLTSTIFIGGVIRGFLEGDEDRMDTFERKIKVDTGILFSSGLIAGEGLIGVILAFISVMGIDIGFKFNFGVLGTAVCFSLVIISLLKASIFKRVYEEE